MEDFSLNTHLIPTLKTLGIKYRYINDVYDPMTIIVKYKNFDICRIDAITDLKLRFSYAVYWFSIVDPFFSLTDSYRNSYDLCNDIINAFRIIEKRCLGKKEDKMDKKLYTVTDMRLKSTPHEQDEIDFTVSVMGYRGATPEDATRIKKAIESISENNEYHGGFTTWRNEYQKERDKFEIKDVIFNNPATIVLWTDGTKTVVKAENEEFDPEKGLAMAIAKKALGNSYDYYDIFKKYVGRYEKKQKKGGK